MILREFLYLDTEKVRSMEAQLNGGVSEEEQATTRRAKRNELGMKGMIEHYHEWGDERHVSKSLGDAMFPILEDQLEGEGLLTDISQQLRESEYWRSSNLRNEYPPGSLIRITASGTLFDARYVATTFAGFASACLGLQGLGVLPGSGETVEPKTSTRQHKVYTGPAPKTELEDQIPDIKKIKLVEGDQLDTKMMRAFIRIARGLFTPGLHINLMPTTSDELVVSARLQEGRQFLDGDSEVLFARYGVDPQEWTIVGTVGNYSREDATKVPSSIDLTTEDGDVTLRGRTAKFINAYMGLLGGHGFVDLPQYPGFSIVPLAVYRVISPNSVQLTTAGE